MEKWRMLECLDVLLNGADGNDDWDFYWKVRRMFEEKSGEKIITRRKYKNTMHPSPLEHRFKTKEP